MINVKKWLFPFLILFIAVGIIFYQFLSLPKNLALDEVEFAKLALSLDGKPLSPYNTMATGHSTLYFYVILVSLKLFGVTSFALRVPSAIAGIACGLLFYFFMKVIFKREIIVFISALVFITSRWFFGFARFGFEPTFLLFLELSSVYFLFQYFKILKWRYLILSGIFAGLAFNSYTPGRIFFLLPLGFLLLKTVKQFSNLAIKQLLYFFIPFIILIIPLQSYLFTHEDIRVNQLFFLSNPRLSIQTKTDFLVQNITKTAGMFFVKGDSNGKHNYPYKPALNPILGVLFISGIFIALKNYRNQFNLFLLLYSLFSILPTLLVYPWENPSMLRTYTILPAVSYFSILPLQSISQLKKFAHKKIVVTGIVILFILSSLYELRTYFTYQALVFKQSFEVKRSLNEAIKCPNVIECKELPK